MVFEPDKISKDLIQKAVDKIEKENIQLEPSTKFDVIINGKAYPPKEVMRYAHELLNGEHIWYRSGGEPTNKYFIALGYEIRTRADSIQPTLSSTVWKLGTNWGKGAPSFYEFIKKENIVIGVDDKKYEAGDLILICEGYTVKALARVNETPIAVTTNREFENTFRDLSIEYLEWVNYSEAEWYELNDDEELYYRLQQGIVRVNPIHDVYKQALQLWNDRNRNYWIFQGNPDLFDYETAIKENLLEDWTVSAHKDRIKEGDKVILWISGKNSGCYALAEVTRKPQIVSHSKDSLWKTEEKNLLKAGIKITHNLINNPITLEEVRRIKELADMKVGNQGTNSTVTKKEYKKILEMAMNKDISELLTTNQIGMRPKNIILYGPPGTGKTYNSIDKAVELATGKSSLNHPDNKSQFDELRKEGQIEFVTFHQNYSYEDFVIGISPDITSGTLRFDLKSGTFKQLAERAKQNWLIATNKKENPIDFNFVFNSFFSKLIEEEVKEVEIPMKSKGYKFKITSIEIDEGRIKFTKQSGGTAHDLLVKNLKGIYEGSLDYLAEGLGVYYYPLVEQLKEFANKLKPQKEYDEQLKNYVLVIDEINRANISKVFGELITLIEEDKRLGEPNELKITLQNGEKDFGVPPNLFIIGTMNTADKSIALIDIALRRRFDFISYYPQYDGYDSDAIEFLKRINEAIFREKKSADYLIGHAYFMKGQSIETVLQNKIIPLLMEYFSGKTDIVSRIFTETSWNVSYDTTNYNWNILPR